MPFAVFALALAAFSVGTAEFIIAGLLPALAKDLSVSIATAGLLVTAYAAGVAVISPIIAMLTARVPRRTMLIGVLVTFAIGQVLCALSTGYAMLLVSRLLVACAHGVFFGVSLIIISALIAKPKQGRAFSIFFAGLTLATILGVPIGAAIGFAWGWRISFWFVGALSVIATVAVIWVIPRTGSDGDGATTLGPQVRQLAKQEIYLSYAIIAFNALGFFTYVTYQVPLLHDVTGIVSDQIPIYLFISGFGSVVGSFFGGRLSDWKLMPSMLAVLIIQAALLIIISLVAGNPMLMAVVLFLNGTAFGTFATPIQARIVTAASDAPSLASTLISTAFNIGIAGGALMGSLLLAGGAPYTSLPALAAACSVVAAALTFLSWQLERRAAPAVG